MKINFFGTLFSKLINALLGFTTVLLTTQELGAANRGVIAIMILNVSLIALIQGVFNGSALSYFTPKIPSLKLLVYANCYALLGGLLLTYLVFLFNLITYNDFWILILLSTSQSLLTSSQSFLLGLNKIKAFNYLETSKYLVLFSALALLFYGLKVLTVHSVYTAYFLSFFLPFLLSLVFIIDKKNQYTASKKTKYLKPFLQYGTQIQLNNFSQMINYRLCFYLLEKWKGKEIVGIFSVAIALGEAVWLICKSIATHQFSAILNENDSKTQKELTINALHSSMIFTTIALIVLLIIPDSFHQLLFGNQFKGIQSTLLYLAPGILALAIFTILNHFFTATGKNLYNIMASIIGNIALLLSSIFLLPNMGIQGAAIATSITYLIMLFILLFFFKKNNTLDFRELSPSVQQLKKIINLSLVKNYFK